MYNHSHKKKCEFLSLVLLCPQMSPGENQQRLCTAEKMKEEGGSSEVGLLSSETQLYLFLTVSSWAVSE